jgi:hypothetical protein
MLTQEGKKTNEIRSCETKEHFVIEKCYRMENQMGKTNIGQPAQSILLNVNIYRLAASYIGVSIYEVFLQD